MENLAWFLLIGLVVGWMAGLIMKGRGFGALGNIAVGVMGAVLGGWIAGVVGLVSYSAFGAFVTALIGAMVFVSLCGFVQRAA